MRVKEEGEDVWMSSGGASGGPRLLLSLLCLTWRNSTPSNHTARFDFSASVLLSQYTAPAVELVLAALLT